MKRWIVEGIRHGSGGWDPRVVIIEAPGKAKALSDVTRSGRLRGYELSARLAMPEDNPQDLQQSLDAAMRDASTLGSTTLNKPASRNQTPGATNASMSR